MFAMEDNHKTTKPPGLLILLHSTNNEAISIVYEIENIYISFSYLESDVLVYV